MKNEISIVHIDTEKYWGGGQNQVLLLHKHLAQKDVVSYVFCPKAAPLYKKIGKDNAFSLSLLNLFYFILKRRPKIIHCHSGKSYYYGLLIKSLFPKIKLIFTRRIMSIPKFIKFKARIADHIICVSTPVMQALEKAGVSKEKMTVVYDGVEPEQVAVPAPAWDSPGKFIVGTVGSLMDYKDHATLIKGFAEFVKEHTAAELVIIGAGPEKATLQNIAANLGISEKVVFTGFLENAAAYIKFMSVFVITSAFAESLCTSIIDAFFAETMVIAADTGGIYELVKDGETGLLISPAKPQRLAASLRAIYTGEIEKDMIIKNAYNHAQNFTAQKMCDGNLRVYEKYM